MNDEGQCDIPADVGLVKAISAAPSYSLALRTNGTLVAWGKFRISLPVLPGARSGAVTLSAAENQSQILHADSTSSLRILDREAEFKNLGLSNVVAIATSVNCALTLQSDGHIFAKGVYPGMRDVPLYVKDIVAISSAPNHNLALRKDGAVVAWGSSNTHRQCDRPPHCTRIVAIAAGARHSIALRANGGIIQWGALLDSNGKNAKPMSNGNFIAISSGANHVIAIQGEDQGIMIANQLAKTTPDNASGSAKNDK